MSEVELRAGADIDNLMYWILHGGSNELVRS